MYTDRQIIDFVTSNKLLRPTKRLLVLEVLETVPHDVSAMTLEAKKGVERVWNMRIKDNPQLVLRRLEEYMYAQYYLEMSLSSMFYYANLAGFIAEFVHKVYLYAEVSFFQDEGRPRINLIAGASICGSIFYRIVALEPLFICEEGEELLDSDWCECHKTFQEYHQQIVYFRSLLRNLDLDEKGMVHSFLLYYLLQLNWNKKERGITDLNQFRSFGDRVMHELFDAVGRERISNTLKLPINWDNPPVDDTLYALLQYFDNLISWASLCYDSPEPTIFMMGKAERSYLWVEADDRIEPNDLKVHRMWQIERRDNSYCFIEHEFGASLATRVFLVQLNTYYYKSEEHPNTVYFTVIFTDDILNCECLEVAPNQVFLGALDNINDLMWLSDHWGVKYGDKSILRLPTLSLERVNLEHPLPHQKSFASIYMRKRIEDIPMFIAEERRKRGLGDLNGVAFGDKEVEVS